MQVWSRAVSTQVTIARLRAAAAACDPQAVETARAMAVRDALNLANSTYAAAIEKLMDRAKAAEVRSCERFSAHEMGFQRAFWRSTAFAVLSKH